MQAEQAVFTSLARHGRAGYHLAARSPGVTDGEAAAVARWAPSHDGLVVDAANRVSVNFHRLPSGRFALARTCRGRPEYSGRGWQVYTHALVIDLDVIRACGFRPFRLYRDALALGHLHYRPEPPDVLPRVHLLTYHPRRDDRVWATSARALGLPVFDSLVAQLNAGQDVQLGYDGDRAAIAESLLESVEPGAVLATSFSTSLQVSSVRPYRLTLLPRTDTPGTSDKSRAAPDGELYSSVTPGPTAGAVGRPDLA